MIALVEEEVEHIRGDPLLNDPELKAEVLEARTNQIFDKVDNETPDIIQCRNFFENNREEAEAKNGGHLTIETLTDTFNISQTALDNYYKFAKFKFDCGMYSDAEIMLENYLAIGQAQNSFVLGALWGRLACRILQGKWDVCVHDFNAVKEAIESRSISQLDQIRQRAWLMHWSLFVFLNQRDGTELFIDFVSDKIYLQTMENVCPWLIRYYSCAIILSKRRKVLIRDLLNEISCISHLYSDPITQFLESVYDQFSLNDAQVKLQQCLSIMKYDFFLSVFIQQFEHESRLIMCEILCALSSEVDLVSLSEKLQLSLELTGEYEVAIVYEVVYICICMSM